MKKVSKVFMVRPVCFQSNEQTANSNSFQNKTNQNTDTIQQEALKEFDLLVNKLINKEINVIVFEDTFQPVTPDSIFPNNWISFHNNNTIVLYPMLAENRRMERRKDIIDAFKNEYTQIIDFTKYESENLFLEGTGSIVFDYINNIAYANVSPRTDKKLFEKLCSKINFKPISFTAIDKTGKDVYHTNVLMCIGNTFAIICSDCIPNKSELEIVKSSLKKTNHEIIEISYNQMNSFAGNMYQLFNEKGKSFILMSEQAYKSLDFEQVNRIKFHGEIIHSPIYTIEKYGGGSARCMIADIRL